MITASSRSVGSLTTAAMMLNPSNIGFECLDEKFRLSDGEIIELNENTELHVLIGPNGEEKCRTMKELNDNSSIVQSNILTKINLFEDLSFINTYFSKIFYII